MKSSTVIAVVIIIVVIAIIVYNHNKTTAFARIVNPNPTVSKPHCPSGECLYGGTCFPCLKTPAAA